MIAALRIVKFSIDLADGLLLPFAISRVLEILDSRVRSSAAGGRPGGVSMDVRQIVQRACVWLVVGLGWPNGWVQLLAAEVPEDQQLAVLADGNIMRGVIAPHPIGYSIERPGGNIVLPKEKVRCVAANLTDAYRLQREQMIEPTSGMIVQLAEWCITYRLYDEAADELRRALRRDPANNTARQMLAKLEEMQRVAPPQMSNSVRLNSQGDVVADVEALGGLPKKLASEFTAKVQPLLINKCAGTGCHGGSAEREFRLIHVRLGTSNHRRASEQNLAMVLKYVEIERPEESLILTSVMGAHGGARMTLFGGPGGDVQYQILRNWVMSTAESRQTDAQKLARKQRLSTRPMAASVDPEPLPAPTPGRSAEPPAKTFALTDLEVIPAAAEDIEAPLPTVDLDDFGVPRPAKITPRSDRFDPEVFNRQTAEQAMNRRGSRRR
jgi:hypothetical protein